MHLPELISDLAVILLTGGIVTVIFKKLNQPLVLGYILAGFLIGPYMPFFFNVTGSASISTWSEIGIIILMFGLGLEFNLHKLVSVGGTAYNCAYIELGDPGIPHAIVLMPDWDERDHDMLRALGRALRFAEEFPRGANVSFVKVVDVGHVKAITYERGVEDFTLACGTGCGSIAAALRLLGLSGDELAISMPGGELTVSLTASGGSVQDIYLTGPTNVVCTGDILDEDVLG